MPNIFDTQWFIRPNILNSMNAPQHHEFAIVDHNDHYVLSEAFMTEEVAQYIIDLHNTKIGV